MYILISEYVLIVLHILFVCVNNKTNKGDINMSEESKNHNIINYILYTIKKYSKYNS